MFAAADATKKPAVSPRVRSVVSFNALHWVRDQDAALRGIRAALRPTGRAFLEFVPQGPRKSLRTCSGDLPNRALARHPPPATSPDHLTPEQFGELASGAGLGVECLERELKTWGFPSRQAFADWAAVGCVAWTDCIPEHERAAFIDDVQHMLNETKKKKKKKKKKKERHIALRGAANVFVTMPRLVPTSWRKCGRMVPTCWITEAARRQSGPVGDVTTSGDVVTVALDASSRGPDVVLQV